MSLTCRVLLAFALLGIGASPVRPGDAPATRSGVFPLSAVRPGLKGYGLTVKSATTIERFDVEVLDVMRNYLPKQDVILIRCLGDEFADHRIAQGMSGSPIYFEGKCAGALAYTWAWGKHALAGVTPIERMLEEGERPLEGRPTGAEPPTRLGGERVVPAAAVVGAAGTAESAMVPIGTPVCLGGFSAAGRRDAAAALAPLGLLVQAGGGEVGGAPGGWANLDAKLEPGATLMVDLLRGDLSASALGTCTFVDGDKVYGFGHPFNELGETLLPMSVGYVYTVVSSTNISFKMGSSIRPAGAIVQDRQPGIVGATGKTAPMLPFDIRFENLVTHRKESFRFEVTTNRVFLQTMLQMALREAFGKAETTLGQNTKRYVMTLKVKGIEEPWRYEDVVSGFDAGMNRLLIGLVDRVMIHPSQRAEFEWFKLDVGIEHVDRRATLEAADASAEEVRPGQEITVRVRLRLREGGDTVVETLPVRIPDSAEDGTFSFDVVGGDNVPAEVATPLDVADFPSLTAAFYKSAEVVAVVPTGRVDLDMGGRLVRDVPLSSIPRLVRSHQGPSVVLRPVTQKIRRDVPYVVEGNERVTVLVRR